MMTPSYVSFENATRAPTRRLKMAVQSDDQAVSKQVGAVAPGPKGLPLIGSAIPLLRDILGFMHRGMLEYGDVVHMTAGPPPVRFHGYGIFHPDGVQHVLAGNADGYYKGDQVYVELIDVLGNGLFTSEGEVWRRQKRLVQPLFTHKRVAAYVPMMVEEADGGVARWRAAAERGESVDLHSEMTRVTLRVVGRAVFGVDVDHMLPVFKDAVPHLSRRAFERSVLPVRIPPGWSTPGNRRAARDKAAIDGVVDDLIASRRRNPTEGEDLLNLLLRAQDPDGGEGLSDDEVRDQALIFLMAGHETTATSLTFTFHLLGHHPDVQRRVHEEVDAVLDGPPLTLEGVKALAYTTMTVK